MKLEKIRQKKRMAKRFEIKIKIKTTSVTIKGGVKVEKIKKI